MSRKHNQRTRAEILAKREQPIPAKMLNRFGVGGAVVPSTPNADVRRASRSKYMPTYGENRQRRADARRQQRIEALAA